MELPPFIALILLVALSLFHVQGALETTTHQTTTLCPKQCRCRVNKAYCMWKRNELDHIPNLPKHINYLKFQGNFLPNITRNTFQNVVRNKLQTLILTENEVSWISPDALMDLTNLKVFKFGHEQLVNTTQVEKLLYFIPHSLREVAFRNMQWGTLPSLDGLRETNVTSLDFRKNFLKYLNGIVFKNLKSLRSLDLSFNGISNASFKGMKQIKNLNLAGNWFLEVPSFCDIPQLQRLHLQYTKITYLPQCAFPCLQNLTYLNLNGHTLRRLYNNTFANLSSLQTLSLRRLAGQLNHIESYAFNSTSLTNLYLASSYFKFRRESVDLTNIFAHSPSLKVLDLSFNELALNETEFLAMISPIRKLEELHIAGVGFYYLPRALTMNLQFLRVLNVSKNYISSWDGESVFGNSTSVQVLDFSVNAVAIVNETTFPKSMRKKLKFLNLANNPFSCSCNDIKWFFTWMQTTKVRNVLNLNRLSEKYRCLTPNIFDGKKLEELCYSDICPFDPTLLKAIIVCSSVIGVFVLVVAILWKCRWKIRHIMFNVDQRRKKRTRRDGYSCISTDNDYLYDCLPVYADEDFYFVKNKLMPILERQHGRKLCIRDRDYELGKIFVDNITESIDNSRRILLLLSDNFAKSRWCDFQLNVALHRMLEEKSNLLVVVLLQEIHYKYLTSTLKTLIITSDCITWHKDVSAERIFWEQIRAKVPCSRRGYIIVEDGENENFENSQAINSGIQ